jgi:uncharacterized protein YlxW (UPF0749 family)
MYFVGIASVIFNVYQYFRNPQIETDKETLTLRVEVVKLKDEVKEIKETHLRTLETEIKNLNNGVNELSKTVVKLATIIDERIPRGSTNLTQTQ